MLLTRAPIGTEWLQWIVMGGFLTYLTWMFRHDLQQARMLQLDTTFTLWIEAMGGCVVLSMLFRHLREAILGRHPDEPKLALNDFEAAWDVVALRVLPVQLCLLCLVLMLAMSSPLLVSPIALADPQMCTRACERVDRWYLLLRCEHSRTLFGPECMPIVRLEPWTRSSSPHLLTRSGLISGQTAARTRAATAATARPLPRARQRGLSRASSRLRTRPRS